MNKQIASLFADLFRPLPKEPIHLWAERNIYLDRTSASQGKWSSTVTPYVVEILKCFEDKAIRDITVYGPSQGAKTTPAIIGLAWAIANAPGPTLWITAKDDKAKEASQDRIVPTIEKAPDTKNLISENRHDKTIWTLRLKTCTIDICGAQSQSNLESTPYRYVFADECRLWPDGFLRKIEKRTRTYRNAKRWRFSCPGEKDDQLDQEFMAGDQREWFFPCMGCGLEIDMPWQKDDEFYLKWDAGEEWRIDEVAKTIRFVCKHCGNEHFDTPDVRFHMLARGRWIPQNPKASKEKVSFRIPGLLPGWNRWRDLVDEYHSAQEIAKRGDCSQLKIFINESIPEAYDEQKHQLVEISAPPVDAYKFSEVDPKTFDFLFMTVDVQKELLWGVIRGWMKTGASKLVWCGKLLNFEGAGEIQKKYSVPSRQVMVDSGFFTQEVYKRCLENDWMPLKGDDEKDYAHKVRRNGVIFIVRRPYSPLTKIDPRIGTIIQGRRSVHLVRWSNPSIKDILQNLRDGKGSPWELPADVPRFYRLQMAAEAQKERARASDGKIIKYWERLNKDNHLFDCECMQVVAASVFGILGTLDFATVDSSQESSSGAAG